MTQEDIIRMAREAGYPLVEYEGKPYIPPLLAVLLETVAAAERDRLQLAAECYRMCKHKGVCNEKTESNEAN